MNEKIVSEVVLDSAAHGVQDLAHSIAHQSGDNCDRDDLASDDEGPAERRSGTNGVDSNAQKPGYYTGYGGRNDHKCKPCNELDSVGAVIG
jgi:hypothetical protein